MFMHTIPGVDDGDVEMLCHQVWRTRRRVPDHDQVGAYGAQCIAGIEQRLALLDARSGRLYQSGGRAQSLGGKLERRPRPRGGFIKQKYHPLAAQQRPCLQRIHAARQLEQAQNMLRLEMFDSQQRAACRFIHRQKLVLVKEGELKTKTKNVESYAASAARRKSRVSMTGWRR